MHVTSPPHSKRAFSLVELSIVLVILGLLVGGVLSGRSLIRASELRAQISDYHAISTGIKIFKDKYFSLPGDMPNATLFWGSAQAPVFKHLCLGVPGSYKETCDGNGNGILDQNGILGSQGIFVLESPHFFQQLFNANLITAYTNGSYNGKFGPWTASNFQTISGNLFMFNGIYGHVLTTVTRTLTPEELWNIDTKLDDGKPATGSLVVASLMSLSSCTTTASNTNLNAEYLLTGTDRLCSSTFRNAF
jgi:prepilin-type N-terminal cleavage/methylation domain-containing protein